MELILQEDIKGLGAKNDLVEVKAGYGRNYLIPKGLAILANVSMKKLWQENRRQNKHKRARALEEAQHTAKALSSLTLQIGTKASAKGTIYGAVTVLQVFEALKAKGHVIDRENISFRDPIKTLGSHYATIELHKEVQQNVQLQIIEEGQGEEK